MKKEAIEIVEELMPLFDRFNTENKLSLNHPQKLKLEQVHVSIGAGFVNKSCNSCLAHMMTLIWNNYKLHKSQKKTSKEKHEKKTDIADNSFSKFKYKDLVREATDYGYDFSNGRKREQLIEFLTKTKNK